MGPFNVPSCGKQLQTAYRVRSGEVSQRFSPAELFDTHPCLVTHRYGQPLC